MRKSLNDPSRISFRSSTVLAFLIINIIMIVSIIVLSVRLAQVSNDKVIVVTEQI